MQPYQFDMEAKHMVEAGDKERSTGKLIQVRYTALVQKLDLSKLDDDWRDILLTRDWSSLRILNLTWCQIGESGAKLLGSMPWPNLEILNLPMNTISADALRHLVNQNLPNLRGLNLSRNDILNEGMRMLLMAKNLSQLQKLYLAYNRISCAGLIELPRAEYSQLKILYLSCNVLSNAGKMLTKAEFPLLEVLHLHRCLLNSEGIRYLTKSHWPNFRKLNIQENIIKLDGNLVFVISDWKNLQKISINGLHNMYEYLRRDRTQAIAAMHWVGTSWPANLQLSYKISSRRMNNNIPPRLIEKMNKDIHQLIQARFTQK